MSDLATQLVTVLAVVLGSAMTYLANHLTERSRFKRELVVRWDDRKLDAYAEYVAAVRTCIYAAVLLYEDKTGLRDSAQPQAELELALTTAEGERASSFERLMQLAAESVIEAAHAVNAVTAEIDWAARTGSVAALEDWRALHRRAFAAINEFHRESRQDLNVVGRFDGQQHSQRDLILPAARRHHDSPGRAGALPEDS